MRSFFPIRDWLIAVLYGSLCLSGAAAATTTSSNKSAKTANPSSSKSMTHKKRSRTKTKSKVSKKRGQKAIESERAEQIQKALIREHYMEGEPSGKWDDATQAALRRYQADQGWQSKSVPDSRALIKLGLGPSHDHLLNPESAMTMAPSTADQKANKQGVVDPQKTPATNPVGQSGVPQQ